MIKVRFLYGLTFIVVLWAAGCAAPAAGLAVPTESKSPIASSAAPRPTLTPLRSVCETLTTPVPTETPGVGNPAVNSTPVAAAFPIQSGQSQLNEVRFHSASVDQDETMLVYLPPGYFDSQRRYPVLYMLSGFTGDEHEWINMGMCQALESLTRSGRIQPMIVVLPDGNKSWWFNHALPPDGDGKRWGDYVWKDVVGYVDANYRTLAQVASRAVGGLSAGGQSAIMFALTHPEVFRIVGAHSPSFRGADGSVPEFGTWDFFNQYDPIWLVQNTDAGRGMTLWMDVAAGDYQWRDCNPAPAPQRCIEVFHALLDAKGVQHDFEDIWAGIHDDYYWSAHIPDYLIWYSTKMIGEGQR